jgi:hypothetical protein
MRLKTVFVNVTNEMTVKVNEASFYNSLIMSLKLKLNNDWIKGDFDFELMLI